MKNLEVARVLGRIADLLEFRNETPFKIRAYRRASNTIQGLVEDVAAVHERGGLRDLPGVGESIGGKIDEIVRTGTCSTYEELSKEIPHGLIALTSIDGVGPKTARQLWKSLGIDSLEKLEEAAKAQRIRTVAGMGAKKEEKILASLEHRKQAGGRVPWFIASRIADPVLAALRAQGMQVEVAGSVRRFGETIADVDFLVAATNPKPVTDAFLLAIDPAEILSSGDKRTCVRRSDGFRVDLRILSPKDWGAGLCYFTGSTRHNVRLRQLAIAKGLKLNEYGVWREKDDVRIAGDTEEDVYGALGLPWIAPELREDQGEIEAAQENRLPRLLELADIKGDCHAHTLESDGVATLDALARAARAKGYEYLCVTDHTQSLAIAKGLDPKRVDRQLEDIAAWNAANGSDAFRVLSGTESDIKPDGSLDLPDETLAKLDFVIGSLHGQFRMPREEMTARVTRALSHPQIDVMGHPTGRLMPDREPVDFDVDEVLAVAKRHRTAMEINASPHRLDLSATNARKAKEAGVKIVISTDTHRLGELDHMSWGVRQARRAWIEKSDVLNALPRDAFLAYVRAAGG